jgi:hypothetical protein
LPPPLGFDGFGAGALGFGAGALGVGALFCVDGALCDVDGALFCVEGAALELEVLDELVDVVFLAAFFLAALWCWTLRAGMVPPTATLVTAAGAATLIGAAFTPAPAVSVFDPPDLATPNAAANAATMATRPMAMERVSMRALLSRAPRAVCFSSHYV